MVKVTFIEHDGTVHTVEGEHGASVMETAVANGIDGIIGECGGAMMCATCHCHVAQEWRARVGTGSDGEGDMLEVAADVVSPGSRLSCQIRLTPELDGLVVHLPETQL